MTKFKNGSQRHEPPDPEPKTQDPRYRARGTKRDRSLAAPLVDQIEKDRITQYVKMCWDSEQTAKTIELLRQNPGDVKYLIAIVRNPANDLILRAQIAYVLGYAAKAGVNVSCALDALVDALNRLPVSLASASMHALAYFAEKGWCDDNAVDKVCEVMDNNGPDYALGAQRVLIAAGTHKKTARKVMEELVIRLLDINTDKEHEMMVLYALKGIAENNGDISDALEQIKEGLVSARPHVVHGYVLTAAIKNKRTRNTALEILGQSLADAPRTNSLVIICNTMADIAENGISIARFIPEILETMRRAVNTKTIRSCAMVMASAQKQRPNSLASVPLTIKGLGHLGSHFKSAIADMRGDEYAAAKSLREIIEYVLSNKKIMEQALNKCIDAFNGLQPDEKCGIVYALSWVLRHRKQENIAISKLVPTITQSKWMYELRAQDTLTYVSVFADLTEINGADLSKCVPVLIGLLKANALNDTHRKQVKDALAKAMQNCDDNTKRAIVTEIREIVQSKKFNVGAAEYDERFVVLVRDIAEILAAARDAELAVQKNIAAGSS